MRVQDQAAAVVRLPDRARDIYQFMRRYLARNGGIPPTMREIVEGANLRSTSNARYHMRRIAADGLIVALRRNRRTYYTVRELAECAKGLE